jgi:hypothetical protein
MFFAVAQFTKSHNGPAAPATTFNSRSTASAGACVATTYPIDSTPIWRSRAASCSGLSPAHAWHLLAFQRVTADQEEEINMIVTSDLNYAAILIALGLGHLSQALAPQDGGRLITFELIVPAENLERARTLELGYNELPLFDPLQAADVDRITLGRFLDGVQRVRRSMRAASVARR